MISSAAARTTASAWSPSPDGRAMPARSRSTTNGCAALDDLRLNDQFDRGTVKEQGTAIGSASPPRLAPRRARRQKQDHPAHHRWCQQLRQNLAHRGRRTRENPRHQDLHRRHRHRGRPRGSQCHAFPYQEFDIPTLKKIAELTGAEHYWAQDLADLRKPSPPSTNSKKPMRKAYTVIDDTELFPWFLARRASGRAGLRHVLLALNPPPSP
jgi:Ca-activated chloride channel homolog